MMGLNFGKLGAASGRTLAQQIAAMSPSLWLEPSLTNYQDSSGMTLVTQPGGGSADPPVGKALDLSGLGNHAAQSTSTARPKLSARVNLLTNTALAGGTSGTIGGGASAPTEWVFSAGTGAISYSAGVATFTATAQRPCIEKSIPVTVGSWCASATVGTVSGSLTVSAVLGYNPSGATIGAQSFRVNGSSVPGSTLIATGDLIAVSFTCTVAGAGELRFGPGVPGSATGSVALSAPQFQSGEIKSTYQAVTDANTYDYVGWPLIHVYDTVDDVLNVTFPSSLGSDCTVVTANRGTTPTIATGQTIGTSYTITATNAGRLVFPRALTAAETAIVTKWATQKGALP